MADLLTAYNTNITIPTCIKDPVLKDGVCEFQPPPKEDKPVNYVGGYCVVYPFKSKNGKKYAVRCWHSVVLDAQKKSELISKKLKQLNLPYFVEFEYVSEGIFAENETRPIVRMEWVDAKDFRKFVTENISNRQRLERLLENFVEMVKTLHKHNLSHGDLQHGNVLVKPDGDLILVDYDTMYIDELKDIPNDIAGLPGFQHPSRRKDTKPSPKADYFSELIIYITLKAVIEKPEIWTKYNCDKDSPDLIFNSSDFSDISRSKAYNEICSISGDMANLVENLKISCQKAHFDELQPLEEVVGKLGVETITSTVDVSSMMDKIHKGREKNINEKIEQLRNSTSVDLSDTFEKIKRHKEEITAKQDEKLNELVEKFKKFKEE